MNEELMELGRRAVASQDFKREEWCGAKVHPVLKDGTVDIEAEGRVIAAGAQPPVIYWMDLREARAHHPTVHLLPDLSDPATVGCLLALVREAHSLADVYVRPCPFMTRWVVMSDEVELAASFHGEAAALVAALEAAL